MSRAGLVALGGLLTLAPVVTPGADQKPTPAQWTLERVTEPRGSSHALTIRAVVRLESGWRLYSLTQPPGGPLPTRIWLPDGQPWVLAGPIEGPDPVTAFDPVFGMNVETHAGRVEFDLPVKRQGEPATAPVQVRARYQMCNGELCLRPKTVALELPMGR